MVKPGLYRHWKTGEYYRVLMEAVMDGSRETCVVYVPLYKNGMPTVRTMKDFEAVVAADKNHLVPGLHYEACEGGEVTVRRFTLFEESLK
jgi:hypothetical protein